MGKFKHLVNGSFYKVWSNMKTRCYNPKAVRYADWGGRGITVCDKWLKFEGFYEDMYSSYSSDLELERIDNNGNYELSNCRWATIKEQARNKRTNRFITLNGITKLLSEWCELSSVKSSTIRQRLYVYKWPIEECFQPFKH